MKSSHANPLQNYSKPPHQINSNQIHKKNDQSNLQKLVHLFQSCKKKVSQFIQKQIRRHQIQKRHSQAQNYQEKGQSIQQDNHALKILEETIFKQNIKFHFNEQQSEVILEEGLILSYSMIEKFESHPICKKSRTIKKYLTKSLLFLNNFLVQKIMKFNNLDISTVLSKANIILIQRDSKSSQNDQHGQKLKKEIRKNYQFQVPLLITNLKIPFSFYFIFSALQQKYLKINIQGNRKQLMRQLEAQILNFCQDILLSDQFYEAKFLLINVICESLGCFQFPISYIFLSSIVFIIEKQFTQKYEELNTQAFHPLRLSRQIFSFKNINTIFQTLIKHEKNSFQTIKITFKTQNQKNLEQNLLKNSNFVCSQCSLICSPIVEVKLAKSNSKLKSIKQLNQEKQMNQIRTFVCTYCFSQSQNIHMQSQLNDEAFEVEKTDFLIRLFNRSLSINEFQVELIKTYKIINLNLLTLTEKSRPIDIQANYFNCEKQANQNISQTQVALVSLRTLFLNECSRQLSVQSKKKSLFSLRLLKEKFITILLILLNSKSQKIRLDTIQTLSNQYILGYFTQFFTQNDILSIIKDVQQNESIEKNQTNSKNLLKNKIKHLLIQVKNRLFDNSSIIQSKSMHFLLKLRTFLPVGNLKIQIFEFITQVFQEKLLNNKLKDIPLDILHMLFSQIEITCNFKDQNKASEIITAKHLISKNLKMIFTFLDYQSKSHSFGFHGDQIRQVVLIVRKLIQKMLWLVDQQQKLMKNHTKKLQYQNLIICYLKQFSFTKQTIKCFIFNDTILQKLISMTELENNQNETAQLEMNGNGSLLLQNLKLILEQLFQFSKQVQKNPSIAKSISKKSSVKSKSTKLKNESHNNTQNSLNFADSKTNFEFKSPSCNLNGIIKNIIKKDKNLNLLNCQILYLLIQKNILLNYQSETNISDTPSKIKRLILSLETTKKFTKILDFIKKEISQCNFQFLNIYIKLYVVICIQINQQRQIQHLFIFYRSAYNYFKKIWNVEYEKEINGENWNQQNQELNHKQSINDQHLIRSLTTMGYLATQLQKFKKIQNITDINYSQIKPNNGTKYSIFSKQTQQAINALQTDPQECFVSLYQQIYDILNMLLDRDIPLKYSRFVNVCLQTLGTITKTHPHLIVKMNSHLRYLPKVMKLNSQAQSNYLNIFDHVFTTKDSILMTLVGRSYENIKEFIFEENESQSRQKYQNLQRFYRITYSLTKQDIISIHDVKDIILYGLFAKNKKINDWTKDYLDYLNQKSKDSILFNDFRITISSVSSKLINSNTNFYQDKQIFRNVTYLTQINKQKHKKAKVLLQKDIKDVNLRSTFIKKVSEIFSGQFDWLKYTNEWCSNHIIFLLKIIEEQTQMDVYELKQLILAMQKVIKEYYFQIIRANDKFTNKFRISQICKNNSNQKSQTKQSIQQNQDQFDQENTNMHMIAQKRRTMFLVGQIMYTLIKLINQKKFKYFSKDLQKLIQSKKFTSSSINISINNANKEKTAEEDTRQTIYNYHDCIGFIKQMDLLFQHEPSNYNYIVMNTLKLTKQFKQIAKKMYSVLFEDQKARYFKVVNQQIKKVNPKKLKKKHQYEGEDDQDEENSTYTKSQYSMNSRQTSASKSSNAQNSRGTKRINFLPPNSYGRTNNIATKKGVSLINDKKILVRSVPKKIQKRLSTIGQSNNDEQHIGVGNIESRRSKRLMDRQSKRKQ